MSLVVGLPLVAVAQESCSTDDVTAALDELPCVADGSYLSVQTGVDAVVERCADFTTEQSCRRCFRRVSAKLLVAINALGRVGLARQRMGADLRAELRSAENDTCLQSDEPPAPPQEPPAFETPPPSPPGTSAPSSGSGNPFFRQPPPPRR